MSRRQPLGQPTKLTDACKKRLIDAILDGNYLDVACRSAGITYRAFRYWMVKGQAATSGEHFHFFQETNAAIAQAEIELVRQVRKASEVDARHAEWMLVHRYPERWAAMPSTQIDVNQELEKTVAYLEQKLSKRAFEEVLLALGDDEAHEAEALNPASGGGQLD